MASEHIPMIIVLWPNALRTFHNATLVPLLKRMKTKKTNAQTIAASSLWLNMIKSRSNYSICD